MFLGPRLRMRSSVSASSTTSSSSASANLRGTAAGRMLKQFSFAKTCYNTRDKTIKKYFSTNSALYSDKFNQANILHTKSNLKTMYRRITVKIQFVKIFYVLTQILYLLVVFTFVIYMYKLSLCNFEMHVVILLLSF